MVHFTPTELVEVAVAFFEFALLCFAAWRWHRAESLIARAEQQAQQWRNSMESWREYHRVHKRFCSARYKELEAKYYRILPYAPESDPADWNDDMLRTWVKKIR